MITAEQLKTIARFASLTTVNKYLQQLNDTMAKYEINTPLRQCHFIAQIIHESGAFRYTEEIASGSAYEGRHDLGNTHEGDGVKFKGRGFMQLTGRANYAAYGKFLGLDLEAHPELVGTDFPADVAGWFWAKKNLNALADADDVTAITKKINGGLNGFAARKEILERAKHELIHQNLIS